MSDEKTHWIEDDATRRKFWAYAKGDLGLTEDEVHKALLCEHIAEFAGDKIAALECLNTYANSKILIAMGLQDAEHAEARTITYCDVYAPDGTRISVTAREGALAGDVARTAETLWRAVEYLTANGWKTPGAEMQPVRKAAKPAPVTKKPPTPLSPSPSAPPTGNPPPPPAPPSGNGGPAPTTTGDVLQTDFVKVTAPKGKPVVEFWRPNRKYAEIRFHLGGEALMKMSPTLAAKGWLAEHFDTVGEEYTLALNVHWEPSKPDGKYKDITKIELR